MSKSGKRSTALLLLAALCLPGCASLLSPPEREPWSGVDDVGMLSDEIITGRWALTVLNPLPGQETQTTRLIYAADGTVRGTLNTAGAGSANNGGDAGDGAANLSFELAGNWQTVDELLVHSNVSLVSRDGSPVGQALSQMFNRQAMAGSANVVEASANRLVMVGDDGQAIRYDRLQ